MPLYRGKINESIQIYFHASDTVIQEMHIAPFSALLQVLSHLLELRSRSVPQARSIQRIHTCRLEASEVQSLEQWRYRPGAR